MRIAPQFPQAKLVISGTDHPKARGYVDSIQRQWGHHTQIEFLGYVAEEDIPALFQSTTVAVMPYSSSAGSSGVAHLACAYGVPILASDISDFRQLVEDEGLAMDLVEHGSSESLGKALASLLEDPERQAEMAIQNFSAALRMSMPEIIRQYLRSFDLQQCLGRLTSVSRLRRMPRWVPFRPFLVRMAGRRMLKRMPTSSNPTQGNSVDCHSDSDGAMRIPGIAVDSDGEGVGGWTSGNNGFAAGRGPSAARSQNNERAQYRHQAHSLDQPSTTDAGSGYTDSDDTESSPGNPRQSLSVRDFAAQSCEHRRERNGQGRADSLASWDETGRGE